MGRERQDGRGNSERIKEEKYLLQLQRDLGFGLQVPLGKSKVHYIEVLPDRDEDEEVRCEQGGEHISPDDEKPRVEAKSVEQQHVEVQGVTIAALLVVPIFHIFRFEGECRDIVTILIHGGATHNFIDSTLVTGRGIPTIDLERFDVVVVGGSSMPCMRKVLKFVVVLGNYTMMDDFYVVGLPDTNIILGIQYLVSLGKHFVDYQAMELEFMAVDDRKVVLMGMISRDPRTIASQHMESIFRYGIEYSPEVDLQPDCQQGQGKGVSHDKDFIWGPCDR
jgi:hypothetical protein